MYALYYIINAKSYFNLLQIQVVFLSHRLKWYSEFLFFWVLFEKITGGNYYWKNCTLGYFSNFKITNTLNMIWVTVRQLKCNLILLIFLSIDRIFWTFLTLINTPALSIIKKIEVEIPTYVCMGHTGLNIFSSSQ